MAISRGKIHHSLSEDFSSLIESIVNKKTCSKPTKNYKEITKKNISNFFGRKHSFLTPYARTSLHTILKALNIKPGSKILMTPINISSMVDIIEDLNLKPIFIDINLIDFGPNYDELENNLKKKPACFFLTYLFGYVPNIQLISDCCKKYNVPLIEDISQNIGATFENKYLGNFGVASIYSSSFTKFVDSYSGSFIITDNNEIAVNIEKITKGFLTPSPSRIKKIILKTLIWNLLLNRIIFSLIVYPLLSIMKIIKPKLIQNLLSSPSKYSRLKILPNYYFEDISKLQCDFMNKKIKSLRKIIKLRKSISEKIFLSIQTIAPNYFLNNLQSIYYQDNKLNTFWQFAIKVKNTEDAKEILFKNKVETGITNLPVLSSFYDIKLTNSIKLKEEFIFIPLHDYLSQNQYERIIKLLYISNQLS